jgi:photosystem II stability/assembly factor-like uncharacterized protein
MRKDPQIERTGGRWFILKVLLFVLLVSAPSPNVGYGMPKETENCPVVSPIATGVPGSVFRPQDKLYDVSVVDSTNVWIVGYFGTVFHSSDAGKSWTRQTSGTSSSLMGVYFTDSNNGWIVGESGTILATRDGGAKWEKQVSPVLDEQLFKVQFVNEREGWVVGSRGVILHTTDGGEHWGRLPFDEDVTLNDIVLLNSSEGWIAGEFETVLHTTDGFKTWEKQRGDKEGKLFGIAFRGSLSGIAVGTSGSIIVTKDGGKNWTEVESLSQDTLLKVRFESETEVVAVGLRGVVVKGDVGNGEAQFSLVCLPEHYTWLSGIAFGKNGVGFLVGDLGKVFVTTDHGKRWVIDINHPQA